MKRLELHYNKKFAETISSYSWMEIFRKRGCVYHVTMTFNRAEDWNGNPKYDYTNDFAIHICDERFNTTHMHIDDFDHKAYGFTDEDIEFFKIALKSQFINAEQHKKPRDVCSKLSSLYLK